MAVRRLAMAFRTSGNPIAPSGPEVFWLAPEMFIQNSNVSMLKDAYISMNAMGTRDDRPESSYFYNLSKGYRGAGSEQFQIPNCRLKAEYDDQQ